MENTVTLDETIDVSRPVAEAFDYVAEFANIQEWDPAVAHASKLTDGPVGVGTEFEVVMSAGFALRYTVVELEQNERLLMSVTSRFFDAREEILFQGNGRQCTIRYIAQFEFRQPISAVASIWPQGMDKVGKSAVQGLQSALNDEPEAPVMSRATVLADKLVLPGIWKFTRLGYSTARKQFHPMSASLRGKHVMVSGATSGLGLAAATALAGLGARLTLVARSSTRAEAAAQTIVDATGNDDVYIALCDMSLMADVHSLCDRLLDEGEPIDVLVNNAGALFNPRQETVEGLEQSFALLLLGPYIMTERLAPLLARSGGGRIVNVLSGGMYSQKIHVDDLQSERGEYSGAAAYARAKRGLMILTQEWAQRWQAQGVVVNAMHPGWADTPGVVDSLPDFYRLTRRWLRTPQQGADTIVWLAAAKEAAKVSGQFWLDREQHPSHMLSRTRETAVDKEQLLELLRGYMDSTLSAAAAA
ncbi:MAG: dehydrogenase/reductase SDR family protein 12 [Bacteroidia bacterium]|jgi:dehydrogenase/reductase SDR family protein 12